MTDIVPSFMAYEGHDPSTSNMLSNWRLHVGEVQEAIPPTDARNTSKKVTEYTVYVQEASNGTMVGRVYNYVTISNMFGSIADNLEYTLRAVPSAINKNSQKNAGAGKGAKVLLLCINGSTANAVIIGAIRDSNDVPEETGRGHHLTFTFNGVVVSINKDGELTLVVDGKTDLDGNQVNDIVGSTVKIDKDGNISVTAKATVNVTCDKAIVTSDTIELGGDGLSTDPGNGVVLGSWVEPITGSPVFALGGTSLVVSAKKQKG